MKRPISPLFLGILFLLIITSCSKPNIPPTPLVVPPPVEVKATGSIKTFTVTPADTILPFKSIVSISYELADTNSKTTATLNNTALSVFKGSKSFGPLKTTTTYTLTVNDGGDQKVLTVKIADSLSTALSANPWKLTNEETQWQNADGTWTDWQLSPFQTRANWVTYFYIDGTSKTVDFGLPPNDPNQPGPTGKYVTDPIKGTFLWGSRTNTIITLNNTTLQFTFNQSQNGVAYKWRQTYTKY
jgi:hypothetical protein